MNWTEYPELRNRITLSKLILIQKLTAAEIAGLLGCTKTQVRTAARNHGISWLSRQSGIPPSQKTREL